MYRATYRGQPVVAKALKTTSVDDPENVHKVSGIMSGQFAQFAYATFPALREGSCRMEVASAREHSTVRRGHINTSALFDGFGLDGEWEYHVFCQGKSRSESVSPRGYLIFRVGRH